MVFVALLYLFIVVFALLILSSYSPFLIVFLSFFIVFGSWQVVSVSYISWFSDSYSVEFSRNLFSHINSTELTIGIFLFVIGIVTFYYNPRRIDRLEVLYSKQKKANYLDKLLPLYCISYFLFVCIVLTTTAPFSEYPLFTGVHRRLFAVKYGSTLPFKLFFKSLTYASLGLGISQLYFYKFVDLKYRLFPSFVFFTVIFTLMMFGHRFSSLVWSCYFFSIPLSLFFINVKRSSFKVVLKVVGGISILLTIVVAMFLHNFYVGGDHATQKSQYLYRRIFFDQGQMFVDTTNRVFSGYEDDLSLERSILSQRSLTDRIYNKSAQLLMYKEFASHAHTKWDIGHMITLGFPANVIYLTGGVFLIPFTFFIALCLSFLANKLYSFILMGDLIGIGVTTLVFIPTIYTIVGGSVSVLLTPKFFFKLTLFFSYLSFSKWSKSSPLFLHYRGLLSKLYN